MRRVAGDAAGRQGARGVGSEGSRPLPAQPPARTRRPPPRGVPQAPSLAADLAPDVFAMRVLLEETAELFRVTNCRSDMTVRELKEELDLLAGIPFNLQRLQYLDQGGPCQPRAPTRTPSTGAPRPLLNLLTPKGSCPHEDPRC